MKKDVAPAKRVRDLFPARRDADRADAEPPEAVTSPTSGLTTDMTARKTSQAKGGGAVAGVLWAALSSNDAPKPTGSLRSAP